MERFSPIRVAVAALICLGAGTLSCAQTKPAAKTTSAKWLFQYDEARPNSINGPDVRNDPRFLGLLEESLRQQTFFWNAHEPLWRGANLFLDVGGGRVTIKKDRYGIISGCVPHRCDEEEGFLWVDTNPTNPEVIFAALTAIPGEGIHASPSLFHLWIFSNHALRQDFVDNEPLPDKFLYPMQDWIDEIGGRHIVSVMFVGPDDRMTPLLTQSLHLPGFQATAEAKTKEPQ
jgi:hypothetical protein